MSKKNEKVLFTHAEDEILVECVARHPSIYDLKSSLYKDQRVKDNAWKLIAETVGRTAADCKKRWKNIRDTYRRKKIKLPTGSAGGRKNETWALQNMLSFLDKVNHKRPSSTNIEKQESQEGQESQKSQEGKEGQDISDEEQNGVEGAESQEDETDVETQQDTIPSPVDVETQQDTIPSPVVAAKVVDTPSRGPKRQKLSDKIATLITKRSAEREQLLKDLRQKEEDSTDVFFRSLAMSVKKFHPNLIAEAKLRTLQVVNELEAQNNSISPISIIQIDSAATSSGLISTLSQDNYEDVVLHNN